MTFRTGNPLFSVLRRGAAAGCAVAVGCGCPVVPSLAEAEARLDITDQAVDCSGADEWLDDFVYVEGDGDYHVHTCTVDCVELADESQARVVWTYIVPEDGSGPELVDEDIDKAAARCEC
jgi:hypothetical protein